MNTKYMQTPFEIDITAVGVKGIGITGEMADPRDNAAYKTVQPGQQTWMAENLRLTGRLPDK